MNAATAASRHASVGRAHPERSSDGDDGMDPVRRCRRDAQDEQRRNDCRRMQTQARHGYPPMHSEYPFRGKWQEDRDHACGGEKRSSCASCRRRQATTDQPYQ